MTANWTDAERIAAAASWAAEAADALTDELAAGRTQRETLEALADGLKVLAEALFVIGQPYPPPGIRPRLRVVR